MEKVKQYLSRYPALLCEIEQTERELNQAPNALKGALRRRIEALEKQALEIRSTVEAVPQPKFRMILKCRYLEAMTFEQVAEALYLSERHVYRLHGAAVREAERIREQRTSA